MDHLQCPELWIVVIGATNKLVPPLPTFTIEKNNIHLLVKSTANIKIQIVIDNYQMTGYNGLLFGGTLLRQCHGHWQMGMENDWWNAEVRWPPCLSGNRR